MMLLFTEKKSKMVRFHVRFQSPILSRINSTWKHWQIIGNVWVGHVDSELRSGPNVIKLFTSVI